MQITRALWIYVLATLLWAGVALAEQPEYEVPDTVQQWVKGGHFVEFEGLQIFVHTSGDAPVDGHGVLVVHGMPGSSWDWSRVAPTVAKRTKIVIPDAIGFGQSDKPLAGTYKDNFSFMRQADMYEAIAKAEGLEEVVLVGHDMGQTTALELMTRHDEGKLSFKIRHAILMNGSTLWDMVKLIPLQTEMLARPDKASTEHLDFEKFGERIRGSYGTDVSDEVINAQTAQVFAKNGDLVISQIMRYALEREEFYDRWVGTFAHFRTAPLSLYWGAKDPVAKIAMAERIKTWNPAMDYYPIESASHWPMIETPAIIADAILTRLPLYK